MNLRDRLAAADQLVFAFFDQAARKPPAKAPRRSPLCGQGDHAWCSGSFSTSRTPKLQRCGCTCHPEVAA